MDKKYIQQKMSKEGVGGNENTRTAAKNKGTIIFLAGSHTTSTATEPEEDEEKPTCRRMGSTKAEKSKTVSFGWNKTDEYASEGAKSKKSAKKRKRNEKKENEGSDSDMQAAKRERTDDVSFVTLDDQLKEDTKSRETTTMAMKKSEAPSEMVKGSGEEGTALKQGVSESMSEPELPEETESLEDLELEIESEPIKERPETQKIQQSQKAHETAQALNPETNSVVVPKISAKQELAKRFKEIMNMFATLADRLEVLDIITPRAEQSSKEEEAVEEDDNESFNSSRTYCKEETTAPERRSTMPGEASKQEIGSISIHPINPTLDGGIMPEYALIPEWPARPYQDATPEREVSPDLPSSRSDSGDFTIDIEDMTLSEAEERDTLSPLRDFGSYQLPRWRQNLIQNPIYMASSRRDYGTSMRLENAWSVTVSCQTSLHPQGGSPVNDRELYIQREPLETAGAQNSVDDSSGTVPKQLHYATAQKHVSTNIDNDSVVDTIITVPPLSTDQNKTSESSINGVVRVATSISQETLVKVTESSSMLEVPMLDQSPQHGPVADRFHTIHIDTTSSPSSSVMRRPPLCLRCWHVLTDLFNAICMCLQVNKDCIFCLGFFVVFVVSASFLTAFFYRTLSINPQFFHPMPTPPLSLVASPMDENYFY